MMTKMKAENTAGYQAPIGIAADPVIFTCIDQKLMVLLLQRKDGTYALPGGFVGATEGSAETAARKLEEKTGMHPAYLEQLRSYDHPDRDPRGWVISVAYLALVPADSLPEDSDAAWFDVASLPVLAFDHAEIIEDATERLRGKLWFSNVALGLLDETFTLSAARKVYTAISGVEYDAANFSRDLKNSGLIRQTGETTLSMRGRPARLYEFVSHEPAWAPQYGKGTKR